MGRPGRGYVAPGAISRGWPCPGEVIPRGRSPRGGHAQAGQAPGNPAAQDRGTGTALTEFATAWLRDAGMRIAMVETGGDDGHAAARHVYERAGYALLPVARYFRAL